MGYTFAVPTGKEKYRVLDLDSNGEAFFTEIKEAYRYMSLILAMGHNYRLDGR